MSLICPSCGSTFSKVNETRRVGNYGGSLRRRRECRLGHAYTTYEIMADKTATATSKLLDRLEAAVARLEASKEAGR